MVRSKPYKDSHACHIGDCSQAQYFGECQDLCCTVLSHYTLHSYTKKHRAWKTSPNKESSHGQQFDKSHLKFCGVYVFGVGTEGRLSSKIKHVHLVFM